MKFSDIKSPTTLAGLPKLKKEEYSLLWHSDWWDGPTSGMLRFQNQEYWFEMVAEDEESRDGVCYRQFAVISLSSEQIAREHEIREDFSRYVRTSGTSQRQVEFHPQDRHHHFYDKHLDYCRNRPFDSCEVIAWFEQ